MSDHPRTPPPDDEPHAHTLPEPPAGGPTPVSPKPPASRPASTWTSGRPPAPPTPASAHPGTGTQLEIVPVASDAPKSEPPFTSAEAPPTEAAGDRFRLIEPLAKGGMGVVYLAEDRPMTRDVAVKVLAAKLLDRPVMVRRFFEEARITGQLQHPAIPPVFEVGHLPDGRPFMAMKLIRGRTLDAILRDPAGGRTSLIPEFQKVCEAVGYAHRNGVLHRDLKPLNIMVGAFGEVQVMDWGLAKVMANRDREHPEDPPADPNQSHFQIRSLRDAADMTQSGSLLGTPAYMAPEQATGAVDRINERTDVFGLGGILCAVLTGKPPFVGTSAESTRLLATEGKISDAHARLDACGAEPELVALCKRCLSTDPAGRPADGGAVAKEVAAFRAAADERARQAETDRAATAARAASEQKRRRHVVYAAAGIVAAMAIGVALTAREKNRAQAAERDARDAEQAMLRANERSVQALRQMTDDAVQERLDRRPALTAKDRAYLDRVLVLWREFAEDHRDTEAGHAARAEGTMRIAQIRLQLRDHEACEAGFKDALLRYEELVVKFPDEPEYRARAARTRANLGLLHAAKNRPDEAEAAFRESRAAYTALAAAHPDRDTYQDKAARAEVALAKLAAARDKLADAEGHYRAAAGRYAALAGKPNPDPDHLLDQSVATLGLADVLRAGGRHAEAEAAYRTAADAAAGKAAAASTDPRFRERAAFARAQLGGLLAVAGRAADAEGEFRRAISDYAALAGEYLGNPEYRKGLADAQSNLGGLWSADRAADADPQFRAAIDTFAKLVADFPDAAEYRDGLAAARANLARLLAGKPADAEPVYRAAIADRAKLSADHPTNFDFRTREVIARSNLVTLLANAGQFDRMEPEFRAALRAATAVAADFPGRPEATVGVLRLLVNGAAAEKDRMNLAAARELLADAEPHLPAAAGSSEVAHRLAVRDYRRVLASVLVDQGEYVAAAAAVEALLAGPIDRPADEEFAAILYCLCAGWAANDTTLDAAGREKRANRYADRAVTELRWAAGHGLTGSARVAGEAFDPIRGRPGYAALLAALDGRPAGREAAPGPRAGR